MTHWTQVLSNVSLEIPTGCLYGLIGPGASGKSVLLKMITGLMRPDRGSVVVLGEDVTQISDIKLQELLTQGPSKLIQLLSIRALLG